MAPEKPGRNDPCPCGSGKKYKRCCLAREGAASITAARYRRAHEPVPALMHSYATEALGKEAIECALDDWSFAHLDPPVRLPDNEEALMGYAFQVWLYFTWTPIPVMASRLGHGRPWPIARAVLDELGERLDPDTRRCIEAHIGHRQCFWSIVDVHPGGFLELENVMTGETRRVHDKMASQGANRGSLLFTSIIEFDGMHFLTGAAPVLIPPNVRLQLVRFRDQLAGLGKRLSPKKCDEYADQWRVAYLEIVAELFDPTPPMMTNTEGDPIREVIQEFSLSISVEEAFERLQDIAKPTKREDLLRDTEQDEQGRMISATIPWLKPTKDSPAPAEYMHVAEIDIEEGSLIIETNSDRRARNAKALVKRRLGDAVRFLSAERRDLHDVLAERKAAEEPLEPPPEPPPELAAQIEERQKRYYLDWLDSPLPALDGKTPREAARSKRGRELLEALLADFAQRSERLPHMAPDIGALRRELKLPELPER